jgi:hypothetical protein
MVTVAAVAFGVPPVRVLNVTKRMAVRSGAIEVIPSDRGRR